MYSLEELQKQQVGLRLPKYLLDDIDAFTKQFSLNRTEVIVEAIKTYVQEQKNKMIYDDFEQASRELKETMADVTEMKTLDSLLDELEDS